MHSVQQPPFEGSLTPMACFDDQWEPRARRRRRRKSPRRVSYNWLRERIPDKDEVSDTQKAVKIVADANLEECLNELAQTRQDTSCPFAGSGTRRLNKQWSSLLKHARAKVQSHIDNEFGPDTKVQPLDPDMAVKEQFFEARKIFQHTTTLTYHGTKSQNIDSISRVGLLMPGNNGHKVANGSAHGVGIYTAQLGKATLSKTFCDSNKMFVCAVCDTSQPVEEPEVPPPCLQFGCRCCFPSSGAIRDLRVRNQHVPCLEPRRHELRPASQWKPSATVVA